jgi:hypothetical protein
MKRIITALTPLLFAAACGPSNDAPETFDSDVSTVEASLFARVHSDGDTTYAFQVHATGDWHEGRAQLTDGSGARLAMPGQEAADAIAEALHVGLQSAQGELGAALIPVARFQTTQAKQLRRPEVEEAVYIRSAVARFTDAGDAEPHRPTDAEPHSPGDDDDGKGDDDDAEPHYEGTVSGGAFYLKQSNLSAEPHSPATL